MGEFYLSLLSDSSMDIFPKNKQFSFTTKLNHPIQVQKEQWVVALVEIMTPLEVYNISHDNNYFYIHFYDENVLERLGKSKMNTVCMKDGSCPIIKLFIPAGNYNSPQHLVEQIQIAIEEKCGAILRQIHSMITLSYKKSGNRVNLHVENPNRVQIRFSKSLGEILGLNPDLSNKLIGNDNQTFTYAVDLNMTHHQMFVYSDVADYTYLGNITAPILRIVSYKQSKSSTQSHQEFVNLHYVPLAKSYIDQVHIDIKDEIGRSVPFVGGKTLVKLHFKRIKKLIHLAISINMMVLVDMSYCSTNTKRRRMDLSARQKNTRCNDDMMTPASKKSTKYQMSYGQIRYLMKRLSTALDSKLKQGRPPKYCRMCHRELRKLIGSQLERRPLKKKYMNGRNII